MRTTALMMMLMACAAPLAGCGEDETMYVTDARKANGMVVILPGIEGVPMFIFGGRFAVSGAQAPEYLAEAIERMAQAGDAAAE